jgi:hypothetical protein
VEVLILFATLAWVVLVVAGYALYEARRFREYKNR